MKILVVGNLGYVGPGVVEQLRSTHPSAEIIGFDLGLFSHCLTAAAPVAEVALNAQHYGDVRDFPTELLDGVEAVINLAAISNDPMGKEFESATMQVNHEAAITLAEQCKAAGVRSYVYASSCSMYGAASERPKREGDDLNPLTAYARSKVAAEKDLAALATEEFVITCCRFATACGFSSRLRLDLVLNDFVAAACAENKITILSDGTPWRPLINVKDMARALDWAISRSTNAGGQFLAVNTGSDDWNYQVKELADAVAAAMPGVEVNINTDAAPDKRSYRVDFSLFKSLAPDHQPQYDLTTTIAELRDGLARMDFNDTNFRQSQLIRHEVLRRYKSEQALDNDLRWAQSA